MIFSTLEYNGILNNEGYVELKEDSIGDMAYMVIKKQCKNH